MRHSSLFAIALLALGMQSRPASGNDAAPRVQSTGSRIVELNEKPPNLLHATPSPVNALRNETQPSKVVDKETPRDNVVSEREWRDNIIRFEQSLPKHLRSSHDKAAHDEPAVAAPAIVPSVTAASAPTSPGAPDEQSLWRMLENRRYRALLEKLERLRTEFPQWRPPARLALLAREGLLKQRIEQLSAAGDAAGLIALAQEHPAAFSCVNIAFAWALAAAHAGLNQPVEAENLARRLLDCPNEEERLATLYKAKAWIAANAWEQLLALEENMRRSPQGERKFQQMRYEYRLEQLLAASDRENHSEAQRLFAALAADIDLRKDTAAALLGAWNHYRLAQYEQAATWFERVLAWDAAQHDAHRGLALCALQQQRHDAALLHAEALPADIPERARLLRDILVAQAQAAYAAGSHGQALKLLGAARTHATLARHAQLLAAWSTMELGEPGTAAGEFSRLYREAPDLESAQGMLNSFTRAGRDDELKQLARTEPLAALVNRHYAARAFADKRFLAARSLAPSRYAALGGAAAPQLSLIGATRSKSGDAGLSRLELQWEAAIEAAWPLGSMGEMRVRMDRVHLDSGTLPDNAPVGLFPAGPMPYTFQPTTKATGWQPKLVWRDENIHTWEAELGLTPSGGAVSAQWTGRLAYQERSDRTEWQLNAYREPARESILSYTGLRDPYQGASWGRVLRNGARAGMHIRLSERWTLNAQANADILTGRQVARNRRFAAETGIAYNFKLAGFDYAVLGASLATDRYQRNLSQFTYGHGGYFSPQRYWRIGPSFDFMTRENRDFILRGRISIGRSGKREAAAPLFPLSPDERTYAESRGVGGAYDVELGGVWRLSDRVHVGALVTKRHSPQYNDYAALGFVRILLESRQSTLSSDLRASMGKDLF